MATLTTTGRNAACDGLVATLNGGQLHFHAADHTVLAILDFSAVAFSAAIAGVATANVLAYEYNATAGTIDHAHVYNSVGVEVAQLTVGVGSGEIQVTTLVVPLHSIVSITSFTFTIGA